ncbi:MAG: hypothetical protein RBT63_04685 [Bdellovibrionales bacterium]|nr:hypothetical protein [Bdellovibrionales bacterium]
MKLKKVSSTKYTATLAAGFADPRVGTEFEFYATASAPIALNCVAFHQEP